MRREFLYDPPPKEAEEARTHAQLFRPLHSQRAHRQPRPRLDSTAQQGSQQFLSLLTKAAHLLRRVPEVRSVPDVPVPDEGPLGFVSGSLGFDFDPFSVFLPSFSCLLPSARLSLVRLCLLMSAALLRGAGGTRRELPTLFAVF